MKILNIDPDRYSKDAIKIYSNLGCYSEGHCYSRRTLKEKISDIDILVMRLSHKIDSEILSCAKKLKYIVTNCTGLDHIDTEICIKNGIQVISLKGDISFLRNIHSTAELTWGLVLDSFRNIAIAQYSVRYEQKWDRNQFFGRDLFGKKIGILGFGRIGEKIATFAAAFGMKIYAYDPIPLSKPNNVFFLESIESFFEADFDVITICVSYSNETHHLVNKSLLNKIPREVVIVNTSRGAVVCELDIIEALESEQVSCYSTDVLENENNCDFLSNSPIYNAQQKGFKIRITPHIGGVTNDSWWSTEMHCATKLARMVGNEKI